MKRILLYHFLVLVTIFQINTVSGQTDWTNFTNTQGIIDIEESEDVLWMASTGGLTRVDLETNEILHFNRGNSGIPSNHVYDILLHPDGTLWISTSRGICTYKNEVFELSPDRGRSFTLTPDNRVALIIGNVIRIYTSLKIYEDIIKPSEFNNAKDLHINSKGTFYLAISDLFSGNDIISYKNGEWEIIYRVSGIAYNYLALDNNDRLWLYNYEGLKYYEEGTWHNVSLELQNPGRIHKIEVDIENNVYLYENNNDCNILYKWDGTNQETIDYRKDDCQLTYFVKPSALQSDLFYATHRVNGYYTFSSSGKGNYSYISQSPIYSNQVKATYHYSDGRKVIVARKNIQIYDQGEWTYLPVLPNFDGHMLYSSFVNDVLWVSDTKSIWYYENEEWTEVGIPMEISSIDHLAVGDNGDVWVSKFFTLYRYRDLEWTKFGSTETGISTGPFEEILVQQTTGDFWLLHKYDGGVYHFDDAVWTFYEIPEFLTLHNMSSTPTKLFIQAEQNLYSIIDNELMHVDILPEGLFDGLPELSTDENGERLYITDFDVLGIYEDGNLSTYTLENSGMYNNYTNHISLDENDNIWLCGETGGLSIFDPSQVLSSDYNEKQSKFSKSLKVYPTFMESEFINVKAQEAGLYSITLTDTFGNTISQSDEFFDSESEKRIQIGSDYTGLMFITVTRNGRIHTEKIVKF